MRVSTLHNGHSVLDHAALLGGWRNTDPAAGGVRRLVLSDGGGDLRLRVLGAGRRQPYDWGEIEARAYAATPNLPAAWAFTAVHDTELRGLRLAAYTRGGLLVVTTYQAFSGPGWPAPYWTREFFHRDGPAAPMAVEPAGRYGDPRPTSAPLGPWQLDPSALDGLWRNVDAAATRLARVRIRERDGYLAVRPYGVWAPRRHDWHETVGSAYAGDMRSAVAIAFTAFFELAAGRVEMVGYLDRRLLTIETASTFGDGGHRYPCYVREHFYRAEGR
ncbi:hypothetical protein [Phytohabitans aurantiacus]|jgi:hypothetical protein|uniref:Lipocalin-like domain-containing protein n=1 Tax=Phytohabitans aurantiacus TaxID=3016789 RepID=A0ABQ5QQV1_9ACTN|nr:hypothetical protein [Phytohabitans aurantiacus]GLH96337.1 hypothetical protein Pa4123_16110 [Phytohabitans aurantiacus]